MPSLETAARSLKVKPITAPVHSDTEIETAIVVLGREPGGGLVVMPDVFMQAHRALTISVAARNNVPAVYFSSLFARDGGLLSYGVHSVDTFRRAASYVDRILRGEKPGDLSALKNSTDSEGHAGTVQRAPDVPLLPRKVGRCLVACPTTVGRVESISPPAIYEP
jgi:ABC-type uncharacterized transport system substrate-binding protein